MSLLLSFNIDNIYVLFHDTKQLQLYICNSAITVLKPSPYSKCVLHFVYMNSSNDFNKSTLKYLECTHDPKRHPVGNCYKCTFVLKCSGSLARRI